MNVYLASPSNQLQASCLAGLHVLESFALHATSPWMERYRPTFAGMMLDSGAYSVMTAGAEIDLGAYIDFAVAHAERYDAIVNLDVIVGDVSARVSRGLRNLERMRDAGLDPLPVFHQGEPWSVMLELASTGKLGLGLQRPIANADAFLAECFARLPPETKVHGFGLANARYTGRYPFSSVDSATWVHELTALLAVQGQGSDVLRLQTPGELLALVVRKYERLPKARAWAGSRATTLFDV